MVTGIREWCGGRVDWRAGPKLQLQDFPMKTRVRISNRPCVFFSQHNEGIRNKLEAGFVDFNLCYN